MKINRTNVKLAFRKIAENTIRAVLMQSKLAGNADFSIKLDSPALPSWSKTHQCGYEFVHLNDSTNVSYVTETFVRSNVSMSIKLPSINNVSILSSGNITKGSSCIVNIANSTSCQSLPFAIVKLHNGDPIESTLQNTSDFGICMRCRQPNESSLQNFCISHPNYVLLDDYTALFMQSEISLAESSMPAIWGFKDNSGQKTIYEFDTLDSGLVVFAPVVFN